MPAPNVEEVQVPCSLFLGLNTEVAPPDLPEGVSPANQDVAFVPGSVFSRPGLHKIFSTPFPGNPASFWGGDIRFPHPFTANPTVTYQKTFLQPNQDPLNLYMTSDGDIWVEDILNSPGAYTLLAQIIAGLQCESVTASGAEYMPFSDGILGQDIPRQVYRTGPNGTLEFDRVSQDGPGAPPTVIDYQAVIAITEVLLGQSPYDREITSASQVGNICTLTIGAHQFLPGQEAIVFAAAISGYDGTYEILSVTELTISYYNDTTGLATGGIGGQVDIAVAYCETSAAHGLNNGDYCTIADTTVPSGDFNPNNGTTADTYSGTVDTDSTGFIVSWVSGDQFTEAMNGGSISVNGVTTTVASVTSPTSLIVSTQLTANQTGVAYSAALINPPNWQVVEVISPTEFLFSIADSTQIVTSVTAITGGSLNAGGQSSPGLHQVVCMFLTRSGYLTEPSPPLSFQSVGNSKWQISNLPIGPPNVVARVLGFTGAGGDNFFTIESSITFPNPFGLLAAPVVIQATVVNDNTSTTAIMDVADNALFGAQGIDIDGNDLFNQVVLGPCVGMFYYASRLITWGMLNKIENFLNMGFEGGILTGAPNVPLGWAVPGAGGALVPGENGFGYAWQITGDGSASRRGEITQSAYQNAYGVAIAENSVAYSIRAYISVSAGATGILYFDTYSPTQGLFGRATLDLSTVSSTGFYIVQSFPGTATDPTLPPDVILDVYAIGLPNGAGCTVDEIEMFPTYDPFFESFLISYVDNFEAFDGVSGVMGPTSDANPLRGCETIRDQLQFLTSGGMHQTSDNGEEPANWVVSEISNDTGLAAFKAIDSGEECIVFVSKSGGGDGSNPTYALRIYEGGQPWKISQEVQQIFDDINPAAESNMWLVNDIGQRRIYIGVPTGEATAPNQLYVLDYREIDTAYQIAQSPSIHISFTGKMIASDLARKWTVWNIQANCGAMLARSAQNIQFCLGAGNGLAPGMEAGFGNVYFLDPAKLTDDDYGVIVPFYTMYFFISRDNEQALGVGSMRKLYKRVSEFVSGVGVWTAMPYAASLSNPWPSPPPVELSESPTEDPYHGLNVSTERMAVKYSVTPLPGETDVQFNLQHMEATVMQHPISPFGTGANL